jgi:hypothetical protein
MNTGSQHQHIEPKDHQKLTQDPKISFAVAFIVPTARSRPLPPHLGDAIHRITDLQ